MIEALATKAAEAAFINDLNKIQRYPSYSREIASQKNYSSYNQTAKPPLTNNPSQLVPKGFHPQTNKPTPIANRF
jgi:hypothetical protein